MERVLVFGDSHLEAGIPIDKAHLLLKSIVQKSKFNTIICVGDMMDFSYISRWVEGQPGLVEGKRLKDDMDLFRNELKFFKKHCSEMIFLCGNHEERVMKFLLRNPVLEGVFSLEQICKEEGVTFIPVVKQPYRYLPDLYVTHGVSFNKYFSAQIVERAGVSIIQGHAHRSQSFAYQYPDGRRVIGYGLGTLGSTNPDYVAGQRITGHTQSFGILCIDSGIWQFDMIYITNGKCIVNGKLYSVSEDKNE